MASDDDSLEDVGSSSGGEDDEDGLLTGDRLLKVWLLRAELLLLKRLLGTFEVLARPHFSTVTLLDEAEAATSGFLSTMLAGCTGRRSTRLQRRLPTAREQYLVVSTVR